MRLAIPPFLFAALALASGHTFAKQPISVGAEVRDTLNLPTGEVVSIPPGDWVVRLIVPDYARPNSSARWSLVAISNQNSSSSLQALVFSRSLDRVKWERTGCEEPRNPMFLDTYGSQPNELRTLCSYAWRPGDIFNLGQKRKAEGNLYWERVEPLLRFIPPEVGKDMLAARVIIREYDGFSLDLNAYLKGPRSAENTQQFLVQATTLGRFSSDDHDALASWLEQYTSVLKADFLDGRGGRSKAPGLAYVGERSPTVNTQLAKIKEAPPILSLPTDSRVDEVKPGQDSQVPVDAGSKKMGAPASINPGSPPSSAPQVASISPTTQATIDNEIQAQRRALEEKNQEMQKILDELKRARDEAANAAAQAQIAALAMKREAEQKREAEINAEAQRKKELAQALSRATAPRKALVIGNDAYVSISPLKNAVADANAMASALAELGYTVSKHTNVDERAFKRALREFKGSLTGGEEALFFFAGHGVQLGGTNFLLPVDTRGESEDQVRDESIQLQRVLDDFEDAKTKFTLAVVDACRDNPFKTKGRSIGGRGLAPTSAATGQMVIFSAGAGQQALDQLGPKDNQPNGLFTRVFLNEIKKPAVPVDRVLRSVRSEVVRLARSVGHEQTPALYDQAIGEFFLNTKISP